MNENNRFSQQEKHLLYNSLAILLKAVEGQRTVIDLRNEASVIGDICQVDGFMNVVMKNCTYTDARGDFYPYDMLFLQARNIRYVHIPPKIQIIPAIQGELLGMTRSRKEDNKLTYKKKRAQMRQQEGLAAVEKILEEKKGPVGNAL